MTSLSKLQSYIVKGKGIRYNSKEYHAFNNEVLLPYIFQYPLLREQILSFKHTLLRNITPSDTYEISFRHLDYVLGKQVPNDMFFNNEFREYKFVIVYNNLKLIVNYLDSVMGLKTYFNLVKNKNRCAIYDMNSNVISFPLSDQKKKFFKIKIPHILILNREFLEHILENHPIVCDNFECKICLRRNTRTQRDIVYCLRCRESIDSMCFYNNEGHLCPFCRYKMNDTQKILNTFDDIYANKMSLKNFYFIQTLYDDYEEHFLEKDIKNSVNNLIDHFK